MGYISVRNVHKEFMKDGEPLTILEDINLDIERGEFICLLGPSGSGKSTLRRASISFRSTQPGSSTGWLMQTSALPISTRKILMTPNGRP